MDAERELERGRAAYASRAWRDAYRALAAADKELELSADDLELLARSAYMLGLDGDYVDGLERAHSAHLSTGGLRPADREPAIERCVRRLADHFGRALPPHS